MCCVIFSYHAVAQAAGEHLVAAGPTAAGPTCDVDYNHLSRRAYAVLAEKRWYIGLYADRASAEAASQSFLREMHRAQSNDARATASLAQKAARVACLGRHGFNQWRDGAAAGRKRELYANWQPHDVPRGQGADKKKFLKKFLGSFRTETAARVALDTFLSLLRDTSISSSHMETDIEAAVTAAKQVAAEEAVNFGAGQRVEPIS